MLVRVSSSTCFVLGRPGVVYKYVARWNTGSGCFLMEFDNIYSIYDAFRDSYFYWFYFKDKHYQEVCILEKINQIFQNRYVPLSYFKINKKSLLRKWFYFKELFVINDIARNTFCLMLEKKKIADLNERYYDINS